MKRLLLLLALMGIVAVGCSKEDIDKGDENAIPENIFFYYTSSDGEIVTPYNISSFDATILSNTYEDGVGVIEFSAPVTTIGDNAFYCCDNLTSVTIPNSVTSIEDQAFYGCSSLTSVTIPDSVTSIGGHAFVGCIGLTSVTIPDSVTSIGKSAFLNCSSLTSVTIPDSVTAIGAYAFNLCSSLQEFMGKFASTDGRCLIIEGVLNFFAPAGITEYTIPGSVASIGDNAFYRCDNLTSVTIPDSVTTIEQTAFFKCSSLTSVTIGDSVTTIGDYAFRSCSSLASVTVGDSVTSIGVAAFKDCSSLTSVYCKATTPPSGGNDMFALAASGRKIYVPMESVSEYKSASYWDDYADAIVGYNF